MILARDRMTEDSSKTIPMSSLPKTEFTLTTTNTSQSSGAAALTVQLSNCFFAPPGAARLDWSHEVDGSGINV